ncbi:YdhK family protein [Virgibacillus necropolis]|uniref:DUF1541 domain-containing protein n=1 Tax=Virgibacillus necropolis TaxID=163877 RepID=A0A221MAZ2_9BACI|nr:YdhK family protein [Virgibacillus necropolis]ASN04803.1 hypothetical protein CFK40_07140 [Virgibacillus necropolis]
MKSKKFLIGILVIVATLMLAACGNDNEETSQEETGQKENDENMNMDSDSHEDMDHSSSGEVPDDLEVAEDPKFEVGSQVVLKTDHMKGMQGAEATIVGAYDTTAYAVSYTPTTGGERVENHKWVIHEEIADVGEEPLEPGTEVTINASHMKGMNGANATIDTAKQTTVYMIDYVPTTGGDKVTNHKWVTGSEVSAE